MTANSHRAWTVLFGRIAAAIAVTALVSTAHADKREFDMTIDEVSVNVALGFHANVFAFNGQVPGPLIHVREGDDVTVHVTNNTTLPHTIHWHGVNQTGTWPNDLPTSPKRRYNPENSLPTTGRPNARAPFGTTATSTCGSTSQSEACGDHSSSTPKKAESPGKVSHQERHHDDEYLGIAVRDQLRQRGAPADVADYFTVNGRSFPLTQPIRVHKGDVMRVRMIGAGDEIHEMHLHGHDQLFTHKDGYAMASPYFMDTVPVGPSERYDVIVQMNNPGRFIFHDHVDRHLNMGGMLGGPITVIEYDGIPSDSW